MKNFTILFIFLLCIPVMILAIETDTNQTPPPDWNPNGSNEVKEWIASLFNSTLIQSNGENKLIITSNTSWKSTTVVSEDPGCPADPSFSPNWTKVEFNDISWQNAIQLFYPPHDGIDPNLNTPIIWVAGNYIPPYGPEVAYFRYSFTLDEPVSSAMAALSVA